MADETDVNVRSDPWWGPEFIKDLIEQGTLPKNTSKVVITAQQDEFITVEVTAHPQHGPISEVLKGSFFKEATGG